MDETSFKLLDKPDKISAFKAQLKKKELEWKPFPSKQAEENIKDAPQTSSVDDGDMEPGLKAGEAKGKMVLKGQMWTLLNPAAELVLFEYSPSRATINARLMLAGYKGLLMADAYTAYRKLAKSSGIPVTLLSCWAHARRRFLDSQDHNNPDPVVREVISRIAELYRIEKQIKGQSPRKKKKVRKRSITLLRSLKKYLELKIQLYAPKEAVAAAIQYCLNHWEALSAYTNHGIAPIR